MWTNVLIVCTTPANQWIENILNKLSTRKSKCSFMQKNFIFRQMHKMRMFGSFVYRENILEILSVKNNKQEALCRAR